MSEKPPILSMEPSGDEPAAEGARHVGGAWKWWLTVVLFLATVLTYLDRQTLSLCQGMICEEFRLTNEDYGRLVAAFRWTYAAMHAPAGFIADHFSLRLTYGLAVGLWSATAAAAAFVFGGRGLLALRAVVGVGEAFNYPCATRIVANILPPADRGLASGIFNSGAAVGAFIGPLIITPLAIQFGWRMAFVGVGVAGFLWILLWLWTTRRPLMGRVVAGGSPAAAPRSGGATLAGSLGTWVRQVLLHPGFWLLLIVGVCANPCWYFLNDWIPKYMHDQRGMAYLTAGLVTIPIFLGADLGNLISGAVIKGLCMRGWSLRKARGVTLTVTTLLIVPAVLLTRIENLWLAVAVLGLAGAGITALLANYLACLQDFSFANVGIVTGLLGMACNIFAASVNPWIGRYVDATGNYFLIFVLIGTLPVASLGAVLLFDAILDREAQAVMTPKDVAALSEELLPVLQTFGLGDPLDIMPLGGTATRKWDVATPRGRFVVRVRAAEFADFEATCFDHTVLQRLAQQGLPVPVPQTNLAGSTWLAHDGHVLEVLSWIGGDPFAEGDQPAIRSLGKLLAKFHRVFSGNLPTVQKDRLREDHPDLMGPYLARLRPLIGSDGDQWELDAIQRQLDEVAANLDSGLYVSLPRSVIHGDVHPGNVRFRQGQVAALYDFDYLDVQARVRDVSDAIITFASRRDHTLDPNAMRSLVQPFVPDASLCRLLLGGYQQESPLTEAEWRALPLLVRSRWIQMRLRRARKTPEHERLHFVLHRFFDVIEWLDREGDAFFRSLKHEFSREVQDQLK